MKITLFKCLIKYVCTYDLLCDTFYDKPYPNRDKYQFFNYCANIMTRIILYIVSSSILS